jgi:hypothetical protein
MQKIEIKDYTLESYQTFLSAKKSAIHRVEGNRILVEDFNGNDVSGFIQLAPYLFDYQQFIVKLCLKKQRFAIFADIGLGKTAMFLEWVRHVSRAIYPKKTIIITQLHLIKQTLEEQMKWYGYSNIADINMICDGNINRYLSIKNTAWHGTPIGIVNVDKFRDIFRLQDEVGAVVLDESSCLKNDTGKIRTNIINACKGIPFKLACTATPAPNDRQEYANHALFLDYIDNSKQFFTKFFFNTGSGNDFFLKPHAKGAFYQFLASWSIFLKHPARYGFEDNLIGLVPPEVIWVDVGLTDHQIKLIHENTQNGQLNMFKMVAGGITNRNKLSQISKGFLYGDANRKQ